MLEENSIYIPFRQQYEVMHQSSIPKQVAPLEADFSPRFQYRDWLRAAVFIMFAAAAVLSGVHTIPTVYKGIQVGVIITEDIRRMASILSFLAVELSVFISAYMMSKNRGLAVAILIVGFLVAMAANISSVFDAMNAVDGGGKFVAVILGVGAPLMALMAGAMFVEIDNDQKQAKEDAEARFSAAKRSATYQYQEAMQVFDASVLTAYEEYMRAAKRSRTRPQVSAEVSVSRPRGQIDGQLNGQNSVRRLSAQVSAAEKTDKRTLVTEYFGLHPDALQMSVRTLENVLTEALGVEVKRTLISEVRTEIMTAASGQE